MDFFRIKERSLKKGVTDIYPDYRVRHFEDLLIQGGKFYGIWDEKKGMWSTDIYDVQRLMDEEMYRRRDELAKTSNDIVTVSSLEDFSTGQWKKFIDYTVSQPNSKHMLDEKITFLDTPITKKDYVSKRLSYSLKEGDYSAYDEIMGTLYEPEERRKLEWSVGAIISGESRDIQKFIVLYGEAGKGKSTFIDIVQKLFKGYYTTFDAKALASSNNTFASEVFKDNPLIAIQHDGDLSKIEDNTKLNSIISHEEMPMNVKFKSTYTSKTNCFLYMATNKPVKITDSRSGIIRRLIDVRPSGRTLNPDRYFALKGQIDFELGAIAQHCLDVYSEMGKNYYSSYRPIDMMYRTDVFFNYVEFNLEEYDTNGGVTLGKAYEDYQKFCDMSLVDKKLQRQVFKEELKSYFEAFHDVTRVNGKQVRSWYSGVLKEKFQRYSEKKEAKPASLVLECTESIFDKECANFFAQYANDDDKPTKKWIDISTKLSDLDTTRVHYVKVPKNHIVIDFDIKDDQGQKSSELNLREALKWPPTYAEFSKGGNGVHLHYIYDGDVKELSSVYSKDIEVKVFNGNASLRRRLSKCNDIPIAHISSGLPLKGAKMVSDKVIKDEQHLRNLIKKNLSKEIHSGTKPSIDFIFDLLEKAYNDGVTYDVRDMFQKVMIFASNSTNHADYCLKKVSKMHFVSDRSNDNSEDGYQSDAPIAFYDVEVFPNLFLINWKYSGEDKMCVRMINPSPESVRELCKKRLIGFNCRRYDNHILYAWGFRGYTNMELYKLSQAIVSNHGDALFSEAYNLSYTDVYDFTSKKQSLKKYEIELDIHHKELGLPWDQPVPEDQWIKVAQYCDNDVIATEAVFNARQSDWLARQILADVAGMTVNDTTNSLTTRIIFGKERKPQSQFNYRFMGDMPNEVTKSKVFPEDEYSIFDTFGKPIFKGYTFNCGESIYRDEKVGEGGYVYAKEGMYKDVALLDIASMHPSSIANEGLFGVYTKNFTDILQSRIAIKHEDFDTARKLLGGKLAPYLEDESKAKDLAQALKIAINSVYGLTAAKFDNPFRDIRNVDNIVAKRGALFMVNLKHAVEAKGYTVAHIKTDSIKIPNATPEIIRFVMDYGKEYGYNFEHEATYKKMCLVNHAVYIAQYDNGEWTATGTQFQVPYVFKKLFSKEPIDFRDMRETKEVTKGAIYLDMNEKLKEGEHNYIFVGRVGSFCPIKKGFGGGELVRFNGEKYDAVVGTKGYRWLESETVKTIGAEDRIDERYYANLVDEAIIDISKYGNYEWFVNGIEIEDDTPPWDEQ